MTCLKKTEGLGLKAAEVPWLVDRRLGGQDVLKRSLCTKLQLRGRVPQVTFRKAAESSKPV